MRYSEEEHEAQATAWALTVTAALDTGDVDETVETWETVLQGMRPFAVLAGSVSVSVSVRLLRALAEELEVPVGELVADLGRLMAAEELED